MLNLHSPPEWRGATCRWSRAIFPSFGMTEPEVAGSTLRNSRRARARWR
jgi:hypothetical protein